jgi:phospho-N-acetylmuramoyl-pentapeptide-transferase
VLYELLFPLRHDSEWLGFLNVLRYVPFRTIAATVTAMLLAFILAPWFIRELQRKQIGQVVRTDGPETHKIKSGTPTMGGALILLSVLVPTILWCDPRNVFVWATTAVTAGYGVIGYLDDYLKIKLKNPRGVPGRYKLLGQFLIAGGVLAYAFLARDHLPQDWWEIRFNLGIPFVAFSKHPVVLPAWLYLPFVVLVVVWTSNAVNLTDGLDGLAIVPTMIAAAVFALIAYLVGNRIFAGYLQITYVPEVGELAVFLASLIGAGMGFLWFNAPPAAVFMGDIGSLSLGGALGAVAVATKHEIVLMIVGGLFVVETVSVIVQVFWYKRTGTRVFLMAPLHHHFEKKGWAEPTIVIRFWIISMILALIGLATLKIR